MKIKEVDYTILTSCYNIFSNKDSIISNKNKYNFMLSYVVLEQHLVLDLESVYTHHRQS